MNTDQTSPNSESTLNSWKEIGAHFGRDGRTAQRWEKEEGLPVHRHLHKGRATVYALPSELDAWKESRTAEQPDIPPPAQPFLHRLLPSFATGMVLLLALISVGDTTPELLRAQAQSTSEMVVRQVAEGDYFQVRASQDGRYVSIRRPNGYYVRDMEGAAEHLVIPVTVSPGVEMGPAVFSPDNARLAYTVDKPTGTLPNFEIHLIGLDGQGDRMLFEDQAHYNDFRLKDWSQDGSRLLAVGQLPDQHCDLLVVNTTDGTSKALYRSQNCFNAWVPGGVFSPDGQYVFFNVRNSGTPSEIFSIPAEGGEAVPVFEHPAEDETVGWLADGRFVFQSDRTATTGIWAVEVRNGKAVGDPTMLNRPAGDFPNGERITQVAAIGIGRNGSLFYTVRSRGKDAYTATLAPSAAGLESGPDRVSTRYEGISQAPSYSRDGRWLAYLTGPQTARTIQIRNLGTGEERSMPQPIGTIWEIVWFPNGEELLLYGRQGENNVFYRMNAASGAGSVLLTEHVTDDSATHPTFDKSGEWLYFRAGADTSSKRIVRYRLSDGRLETVVGPGETVPRMFALSPDNTQVAVVRRVQGIDRIEVVPASGGTPKTIYTFPADHGIRGFGALEFTADGKAVLHAQRKGDGFYDDALRVIPLDGSPSHELADTKMLDRIVVHPDGQRIAWGEHYLAITLWVAEHFVPAE